MCVCVCVCVCVRVCACVCVCGLVVSVPSSHAFCGAFDSGRVIPVLFPIF